MKKIICIILALLMTLAALPVSAAVVYTYYCEDGITAEVDVAAKTLTLSGIGEMMNYTDENRPPWYERKTLYNKVIIEDGITSIGDYAFADNLVLVSADIPDSVTRVGNYGFHHCIKLTEMHFSENVSEIGIYALADCLALKSVTLPKKLEQIPRALFRCSYYIENLVMPTDCSVIGAQAFLSCSYLKSITLPENLKKIDIYAFNGCNGLSSVTIPEGTEYIGDFAFYQLSTLKTVNIPTSVTHIGEDAFCSTPWYNALPDGFNLINGIAITYKGDAKAKTLEFPEGTTTIAPGVCGKSIYATEIIIPDTVTTVCEYAFYGLTSLYSVTVPKSVETIGEYAFGYFASSTGSPSYMYPFTIYSGGCAAAMEYANDNQFDFVCIHKEGDVVNYPDCTVGGIATKTCEYCGEETGETVIPAGSHSFGAPKIYLPTCTENGYIKKVCSLCQYEKITETEEATGHVAEGGFKVKAATCGENGLIYKTCATCGETFDEIEIEKLPHTPMEEQTVTKAATCTEEGEYNILCEDCGEVVESGVIAPKGHTLSLEFTVLTESEYKKKIKGLYVRECEDCDIVLNYGEFYKGDMNGDDRINSRDTMSLKKGLTNASNQGLTDEERFLGDLTGDGRINSRDTMKLKRSISNN